MENKQTRCWVNMCKCSIPHREGDLAVTALIIGFNQVVETRGPKFLIQQILGVLFDNITVGFLTHSRRNWESRYSGDWRSELTKARLKTISEYWRISVFTKKRVRSGSLINISASRRSCTSWSPLFAKAGLASPRDSAMASWPWSGDPGIFGKCWWRC